MLLDVIDRLAGKWLDWRTELEIARDPELSQFGLKRVEVSPTGFELTALSPGIALLAQEAAELLEKNNAKNYIQVDLMPRLDRKLRPIRITIQWATGESPANKAARLERELSTLLTEISECSTLSGHDH